MAKRPRTEDDFHRQETIVEKSDRMAREISQRREIRLREERVRLLNDVPETEKLAPSPAQAPVQRTPSRRPQQKVPSQKNPKAPAKPRRQSPRVPPSGVPKEFGDHTHTVPVQPPSDLTNRPDPNPRPPRLSDPFPPLQRAASASQSQGLRPPEAPQMYGDPQKQLDVLAVELEDLVRQGRTGWRLAAGSDKVALAASCMMFLGVFAPWTSRAGNALSLGLFTGGVIHLVLGALSVFVVVSSAPAFASKRKNPDRESERRYRRGGLWLVLLGTASTIVCVFLLGTWIVSKLQGAPVDIHPGFYWTLAWGTGVSYGGYARFGR